MFTLRRDQNDKEVSCVRYFLFSLFCLVFFLIYDRFSHGVRSPYMTFLWLWPSVLGFVPSLLLAWAGRGGSADLKGSAGRGSQAIPALNTLYHYGVITLTAASLLKGIFDIAGTGSVHVTCLFTAGAVLLVSGLLCSLHRHIYTGEYSMHI